MKKRNRKLSGKGMVRATSTAVVEAAGTSEGVKKSWEMRRGAAHEATQEANSASERAYMHDYSETHHNEAHEAHTSAANAHEDAADEIEKNDPDGIHSHLVRSHRDLMKMHIREAARHEQKGDQLRDAPSGKHSRATETEEQDAAVKAAGTSEGVKKSWETRHGMSQEEHLHDQRRELTKVASTLEGLSNKDNGSSNHENLQEQRRRLTKIASHLADNPHPEARVAEAHVDKARHGIFKTSVDQKAHESAAEALKHVDEARRHIFKTVMAVGTEEQEPTVHATQSNVIHCKASGSPIQAKKTWEVDKPIDFMWMPGGVHTIHASYGRNDADQRPIQLTVACTKEGAESVQSNFASVLASNSRRPPFICVEHRAQERAGVPVSFEWRDEPEPAIYCRCLPSALGANNVNGKIHTSFSPTFDTNAEYHKMQCTSCNKTPSVCSCESGAGWYFPDGARGSASNPAKVTAADVQSVGSLTNWNAFRDILPIAARENKAVEAAGTSEGAKKGWEKRQSWDRSDYLHEQGLANKAGTDSEMASEKAEHSKKWQDHSNAQFKHELALTAHQHAKEVALGIGAHSQHQLHDSLMSHHRRMSDYHFTQSRSHTESSETNKDLAVYTIQAQATQPAPITVTSILASKSKEKDESVAVMSKLRQRHLGLEGKTTEADKTKEPLTPESILARMSQTARPAANKTEGKEHNT